ncbi:hypothetical protein ACIBF7_18650 [Nonomuraea sp. NPDC050478]|uniref:hypothetical protein n=1 Tax=Nonomuraea sp. NPDC050478 TaxID=3364365 RepID=UPI00378839A5
MSARLLACAAALVLASTGCSSSVDPNDPARLNRPQNDGANGDVQGVHVRDAFLLGEMSTASPAASPAGQQALYAVLISNRDRPDLLERVTVEGGGTVRLVGPVELRPYEAATRPDQPIGMASGILGNYVPMTFTFRDAGAVRMAVPVMARQGRFSGLPSSPAGTPTPTSTPTPKRSGPTPKPTVPPEHATREPG